MKSIERRCQQSKRETTQSFNCELCQDVGEIITRRDNGSVYAKPCKCKEIARAKELMVLSEIPEDYLDKGFKDFNTEGLHKSVLNAMDLAKVYCSKFRKIRDERNNSIVFCGTGLSKSCVGSGKTFLSIIISNNIMALGIPVKYMPYRTKMTEIKQVINNQDEYNRIINGYKNCSVLIIDDLYKGGASESEVRITFDIINYRYMKKKPVIISTELSIDEMMDIDAAIASRIVEMSKGYLCEIGSDKYLNYRLR